jgi:AGZA family xanthine/uracil permease-like MFS transporter
MIAQAFQATAIQHAPAVALGLFPAIAAWGATVAVGTFGAAGGATIQSLIEADFSSEVGGFLLHGLIIWERGFIFTCMVLAAAAACLIDRRFFTASLWVLAGVVVTLLGLAHTYQISGNSVDFLLIFATPADGALSYRAYDIAIGYAMMAAIFIAIGLYSYQPSDTKTGVQHGVGVPGRTEAA